MPIEALMESADFEPDGHQEPFITVTLRVPRDTRVSPGIYHLEWQRLAQPKPEWASAHDDQ
jgi:hypothetical protein